MRKINLPKILAGFFFVAALSSCSSDSPTLSYGKTTGNYFPMAVTNQWNYTTGSKNTQMNLIETTTFGDRTYYKYSDTDSSLNNVGKWMNKTGASYFQKTATYIIWQGSQFTTMDGIEIKLLQDDLLVGESWHDSIKRKITYNGPITAIKYQNIDYVGQITARDATVTLGGITYTNVIKSSMTVTFSMDSQTMTSTGENWFAKDIGLIYDSTNTNNGVEMRYLTSYELH